MGIKKCPQNGENFFNLPPPPRSRTPPPPPPPRGWCLIADPPWGDPSPPHTPFLPGLRPHPIAPCGWAYAEDDCWRLRRRRGKFCRWCVLSWVFRSWVGPGTWVCGSMRTMRVTKTVWRSCSLKGCGPMPLPRGQADHISGTPFLPFFTGCGQMGLDNSEQRPVPDPPPSLSVCLLTIS